MAGEKLSFPQEDQKENFSRGLSKVEIPQLGMPIEGKVRNSWVIEKNGSKLRIQVTTDRQSAFDRMICTTPGKGQVLNLMSKFWFENTRDIIPNHMIDVPHPNVLIAKEAVPLPVELVPRRFMARSSTSTSVYRSYSEGERNIYGIEFPDDLVANQEFPTGTIMTQTTKAPQGEHDVPLTDEEARKLVDQKFVAGVWEKTKTAAYDLFEFARKYSLQKGIILVDTKYEFGLDSDGNLMLIDEVHTPDSSRFWLADTYRQKFDDGETPDTFDKEILRRWLTENGFKENGPIPRVDPRIINEMAKAYEVPYRMITGEELFSQDGDVAGQVRDAVMSYINM